MFKGKGFYEQAGKNADEAIRNQQMECEGCDEINVSCGTAGEARNKLMENQNLLCENLKKGNENVSNLPKGSVASDILTQNKDIKNRENVVEEEERTQDDDRNKNRKREERQVPKVEENLLPVYDKRADYNRDLKQKFVERGFEVEMEKDLDTLIKETQAKYANMP